MIFRHIDVSPDAPVEEWGVEGILAAIDRGTIRHWRRIAAAVRKDPQGEVAADLDQALTGAESEASAAVLRLVLDRARETSEQRVARRFRMAIARSGLTQAEFAARLGTSASRLSTYVTGSVVPSAAMLDRAERLVELIETEQSASA
ncbi:helix-turn-helix domain-containing protein [Microlunatus parietis]|uniref:Ribosome-binding protein aMBF1 (Putative translation factor) n=1 Tax=Microlunatus parietis TaxID=682979 RepID=A0A7Y9LEL1_9ACTN|nr:helix-turn-helix domain-containing protein [Microlunatus parietis]NYE73963.1 ribosome-binding protein aMBF1 (putative translation factor) [Microlunatus parietis]